MKKILSALTLLSALICYAASEVYTFDLSKFPQFVKNKAGNYEWSIPTDKNNTEIVIDLDALKVVPHDYDELQIVFRNLEGKCGMNIQLRNYPLTDQLRDWYVKTVIPYDKMLDERLDLRRDDDGWWYRYTPKVYPNRQLALTLLRYSTRKAGETRVRKVEIEKIQFIRRFADISFDEQKAVFKRIPAGLFSNAKLEWTYTIRVQNKRAEQLKCDLVIDTKDLKHFSVNFTKKELTFAPREVKEFKLVLSIPEKVAKKMPVLYSERVLPRLLTKDAPQVYTIMGYRPRYVWGTVPPEKVTWKLPAPLPKNEKKVMEQAEKDLDLAFGIQPQIHPDYCAFFRKSVMKAESFYRIKNTKTGEDLSKNAQVQGGLIYHHNRAVFEAMKRMAQAYQKTGDLRYPTKIRDILLEYVHWYRYLPPHGPSSTSASIRITSSTLDGSYFFYEGLSAYAAVKDSPVFGPEDRRRIEEEFFGEIVSDFYAHNDNFSNIQLHHLSTYGRSVIALNRWWNLLGEAVYGDNGFHAFANQGFTPDGSSGEAGVYHYFGLYPLLEFADEMRESGVELIDNRFKRVYDYGVLSTPHGISDWNLRKTYIQAYRIFKDPKYLPSLKVIKQLPAGMDPKDVPDTIFLGNTHMKNNGYLYLREQSKAGFRALAINYIMGWDRMENDRLHFRLFDDKGMISHEVFRIGYTQKGAGVMDKTWGHKTVVVDEKNASQNPSNIAAFLDRASMPAALFTEKKESPLYPGVKFSRAVAIMDGIFFVGDCQKPADGKEHTFDWPFYAPWQPWAKKTEFLYELTNGKKFDTPMKTSMEFVENLMGTAVKKNVQCRVGIPTATPQTAFNVYKKADRHVYLNLAFPGDATVATFRVPRGSRPGLGPAFLLRQKGKTMRLGAAMDVVAPGGKSRVKSVTEVPFTPADPLSAVWEIKADTGIYYVIINRTGKTLKAGKIETNKNFEVIKK